MTPTIPWIPWGHGSTQSSSILFWQADQHSAAMVLKGHTMLPSYTELLISIQLQSLNSPLVGPAFNELIV